MKIRTEDELQDVIDSEIAWRKKELSAVKANINTARNFAKNTALRAGITLLYAHWEGAIKNLAYYYLVYVSSLKIPYNRLKPNFLAITLKNDIRHFDETQKVTLQTEIVNKLLCRYNQGSNIPTENIISANSNLNSTIFTEIMSAIGLPTDEYEEDYVLIDEVLLEMRNKIAHGDNLESLSLDEDRFNEIYSKIFRLIEYFSTQISNVQKPYGLHVADGMLFVSSQGSNSVLRYKL